MQSLKIRKSSSPTAHNDLFEWSARNGKWYPINRRNITFSERYGYEAKNMIRSFFTALLHGLTVTAEGCYRKTEKQIEIELQLEEN
jgi:hypothetical protein